MTIFSIQDDTNEIDEAFCKIILPRYRYLLYWKATTEERLATMHYNDIKNIKAWYETLYDAQLKDKVRETVNNCYITLEDVLMLVKNSTNPLFLVGEEGARKFNQNENIVINSKPKLQSRK